MPSDPRSDVDESPPSSLPFKNKKGRAYRTPSPEYEEPPNAEKKDPQLKDNESTSKAADNDVFLEAMKEVKETAPASG